jgi:hypothetical protein
MFGNFTYQKPVTEIVVKATAKAASIRLKIEERVRRVADLRKEYNIDDRAKMAKKEDEKKQKVLDGAPELGDTARDSITGFEGVVIGVTNWLNGCVRLVLQPKSLESTGKPVDAQTFDIQQMLLIEVGKERDAAAKAAKALTKQPGGPRDNAVGMPAAKRR